MKTYTFQLELITPCFCAGADQSHAEIRVPSIRGELRWWFRALGGTCDAESQVFGGVHGDPVSSSILIRILSSTNRSERFDLPKWYGNASLDPTGYLCYFLTVSGAIKGQRWRPGAFLSPGNTLDIELSLRRNLKDEHLQLFECALMATKRLGSIGARSRRAMGAWFDTKDLLPYKEFLLWAGQLPGITLIPISDSFSNSWQQSVKELGIYLKNFRKNNHLSGTKKTALGYSIDKKIRLSSALHLRPIRVKEGTIPLAYYSDIGTPYSVPSIKDLVAKPISRRTFLPNQRS